MRRILAVAMIEATITRRNRWLLMATVIMVLFAVALTLAGSAPTGTLGVNMLTVSVASMTTLSVYLAPLLALMMAFDSIAGEAERGGLGLLLSYPVSRAEILLGKFVAHLSALAFAMIVGFGVAGGLAAVQGGVDAASLVALVRLILTSILLGAAFLALGYMLSALAGSATGAAGLSAGLWMVFVVLYDLGLLGAVVFDAGGWFTQTLFPWALAANPADAFRLWNVAASDGVAMATGLSGAASALPDWVAPTSLLLWPVLALLLARYFFERLEP
ncbi:ABC transporter permease [Sedimentitalea nanhaiensis]|uniref:ABC transporter permease n=1 Tax=Sedimentitalea nanhaiensis TaxID=999627 RepID=UPI0004890180